MNYQIQHVIHGFYCGNFQGYSCFWPGSGMTLPIFKFKNEKTAQKIIDFWVNVFGMNREWAVIQEYNERLSKQISTQAHPITGNC